jgi:hypothetical protein
LVRHPVGILFLLDNYRGRSIRRFRFEGLSANSKNAGLIVRNECVSSYEGRG